MSIGQRLAAFVRTQLIGEGRAIQVGESTPLIDAGVIDSMGLMQLVGFIEEETGVRIPDDEVTPENFQTIADMERMIARLQSRRAGSAGG